MALRSPPSALTPPNIEALRRGDRLFRVHDRTFAGNAFNPCKGAPTRFAPMKDAAGACVPSLYAGSTLEAAIYETVFHDVPTSAMLKTVPRSLVESRAEATLEVSRPLKLAALRQPDLKKWRVRRADLIGSLPTAYGQTVLWAEAIHHQFADIDGLVWTSNQCDPASAYFFFGDRVASGDLRIIQSRDGLTDPSFLANVRRAGKRSGIVVTV